MPKMIISKAEYDSIVERTVELITKQYPSRIDNIRVASVGSGNMGNLNPKPLT